jgi:hypothetical protein
MTISNGILYRSFAEISKLVLEFEAATSDGKIDGIGETGSKNTVLFQQVN